MIPINSLFEDCFHHDRKQVNAEYEEVKKKIARLDPDSFEKQFLSPCFITKEEIRKRIAFEEETYFRFYQLPSRLDEKPLLRILHRYIEIDFSIISFPKLFSSSHMDVFSEILIDQDDEVEILKKAYEDVKFSFKVEFVYGDEEEGIIRYLIGVYADMDIADLPCLFEGRYRLLDIGSEDLARSISYCHINEGVLLRKAGNRILCSVDHVAINGYISSKESRKLLEYLDDDHLLLACITDKNESCPYSLYIDVRVYENPLKW